MNVWLKKDKQGLFTCGFCRELFRPNPKAILDYSSPDSVGVDRVFCSSVCANKYMVAEVEVVTELQNYEFGTAEENKALT